MSRAEYMREYRAKRSIAKRTLNAAENIADLAAARVTELEAEVARLKRELAARPGVEPEPLGAPSELTPALPNSGTHDTDASFRAFRPAPKPGRK